MPLGGLPASGARPAAYGIGLAWRQYQWGLRACQVDQALHGDP
jgi:hypothetical protein